MCAIFVRCEVEGDTIKLVAIWGLYITVTWRPNTRILVANPRRRKDSLKCILHQREV
jgi:hypothetical protein